MKQIDFTFFGEYNEYTYFADVIIYYTFEDDSFDHEFGFQNIPVYLEVQDVEITKLKLTNSDGCQIVPSDIMLKEIQYVIENSKDFIKAVKSISPNNDDDRE